MKRCVLALAACLVLVTPAQAARRLTIKQAKDETSRQAVIEASSWDGFPQYVTHGGPGNDCKRKSRLRIVCEFWVADRLTTGGSSDPRSCDFRVDVRMARRGSARPRSTVEPLGCERR